MRRSLTSPTLDVDALLAFHRANFGDARMEAPDVEAFLALDADGRTAHLAGLSGDDLVALRAALEAHFAALDSSGDLSDETLAAMEATAEARDLIVEQEAALATAQAEAETRAAALRERMAAGSTPADGEGGEGDGNNGGEGDGGDAGNGGEGEGGDGAGSGSGGEGQQGGEGSGTAGETRAAAGARRTGLGNMARRAATATPRPTPPPARLPLRAAAGIPRFREGQTLEGVHLGEAIAETLRATDGATGQFSVAQVSWADRFGESQTLRRGATADNNTKIDAATSREVLTAAAEAFMAGNPAPAEALVAAGGGFCAPFPIDYDVPVQGAVDRPVRDALARFGAERGGISFTPPPALKTAAQSGVGVWTATDDAGVTVNADGTYTSAKVKPIVEYACLDDITEQVEAITHRASFSNFSARFSPEQVTAHTRLSLIAAARFADSRLLQGLWARADFRVTTAQVLGASRDFFAVLDTLLPQIRYRRRLDLTFPMRVIAPEFLRDMFRADFVRQMPTNNERENMALADATLLAWARARNVNISWAKDARTGDFYGAQPTIAADGTVPVGGAALLDFPDVVEWFCYPEGSVQFLDGGTLDLGVVRDTRTNAVNRYETFVETFEGIAKRETPLFAIQSAFQPTGSASGLTAINALDL